MRYCEGVLKAGRQTTQLIRDILQTSLSLWSIRESNRSIEEAVSVKRLTDKNRVWEEFLECYQIELVMRDEKSDISEDFNGFTDIFGH